jgi:hypothetical protein
VCQGKKCNKIWWWGMNRLRRDRGGWLSSRGRRVQVPPRRDWSQCRSQSNLDKRLPPIPALPMEPACVRTCLRRAWRGRQARTGRSDTSALNWIIRVLVKMVLRGRDLRLCPRPIGAYAPAGVIYVKLDRWGMGPGLGFSFDHPQTRMFQDFLDDLRVLNEG